MIRSILSRVLFCLALVGIGCGAPIAPFVPADMADPFLPRCPDQTHPFLSQYCTSAKNPGGAMCTFPSDKLRATPVANCFLDGQPSGFGTARPLYCFVFRDAGYSPLNVGNDCARCRGVTAVWPALEWDNADVCIPDFAKYLHPNDLSARD